MPKVTAVDDSSSADGQISGSLPGLVDMRAKEGQECEARVAHKRKG